MTDRLFNAFQVASLLRVSPGAIVEWMNEGWLRPAPEADGAACVYESEVVAFLETQGFDFGDELTLARTIEQRDEIYHRAIEARLSGSGGAAARHKTTHASAPAADGAEELRAGQICDAILADAVKNQAQAIHLTPHPGGLKLQLRIDGALNDKPKFDRDLSKGLKREIIACMLNRADPDITPDDLKTPRGIEFSRPVEGLQTEFRLSLLPTVDGPRLVIETNLAPAIKVLEGRTGERLGELLRGDGLILVASRRRIGRDRTLRTLLGRCDTAGRSVISVQQDASPRLDNIVQVRLDPAGGFTFAAAAAELRRQDADTIALSELRDPQTAFNAFEAAHDGSLVLAGINAVSASSALDELLVMGLEPWPLGTTLKAIVEQTSVPAICKRCEGGCERCGHTGWFGRTVISGVVFVDNRMTELIRTGGSVEQFAQAIALSSRTSLADAAQDAVDAGETTVEQIAHIFVGG